jgi:hypothetical protein
VNGTATMGVMLGALICSASAQRVSAQERARPRAEARLDYLGPNPHTVHAGLGVNVPFGTYLRMGVIGAGGASWKDSRAAASARADLLARFSFDPFRECAWALSAGGGLSVRYDQVEPGRDRWRPLLALVIDLEGPRTGSVAPAVQLGLGGGARFGVIIRGAARDRR